MTSKCKMLLADSSEITIPHVPLQTKPLWLLAAWVPKNIQTIPTRGRTGEAHLEAVPLGETAGQCLLAPGQTSHPSETQGPCSGGE